MNISELRHRISIVSTTPVINENGFETTEVQVFKTIWAAVTNLHGKEYFAAKAVQAENTVKFTIRYLPSVSTSMQIQFQDRVFNIVDIDDIKYRKKYLEIKAVEVMPGGQD